MSFNNKALVKLNRTSKFIRSLSTSSFPSNVTLPKLPYAYDALEPVIPKEIMILHHTKHHAAYIANFKKSVEEHQKAFESKNVEKMVATHVFP